MRLGSHIATSATRGGVLLKRDRIIGGLLGLIVGDALGVPFEFQKRDTFVCDGMTGYGTHKQPAGTWSDDSSMTLATMDAILRWGLDADGIMRNFVRWFYYEKFTPRGKVFDVGYCVAQSIVRYNNGADIYTCGGAEESDNGNGALMRILPLAFLDCDAAFVDAVSGLTHNHEISKQACRLYTEIARGLVDGENTLVADRKRSKVKSGTFVKDTLDAALWSVATSDSYKDAVLAAANLGGDTDTVAAVAGGLAGIVYGVDAIPQEWIDTLARKDFVLNLCSRFADYCLMQNKSFCKKVKKDVDK